MLNMSRRQNENMENYQKFLNDRSLNQQSPQLNKSDQSDGSPRKSSMNAVRTPNSNDLSNFD